MTLQDLEAEEIRLLARVASLQIELDAAQTARRDVSNMIRGYRAGQETTTAQPETKEA